MALVEANVTGTMLLRNIRLMVTHPPKLTRNLEPHCAFCNSGSLTPHYTLRLGTWPRFKDCESVQDCCSYNERVPAWAGRRVPLHREQYDWPDGIANIGARLETASVVVHKAM